MSACDMSNEIAHAEKLFISAARRVARQVGAVRAGHAEAEASAWSAIERLYDRAFRPEIRGDEAVRERCYAQIDALRVSLREASEAGAAARRAARDLELTRIDEDKREWNRRLTTYEREIRTRRA